jgi:hypothetical protein
MCIYPWMKVLKHELRSGDFYKRYSVSRVAFKRYDDVRAICATYVDLGVTNNLTFYQLIHMIIV